MGFILSRLSLSPYKIVTAGSIVTVGGVSATAISESSKRNNALTQLEAKEREFGDVEREKIREVEREKEKLEKSFSDKLNDYWREYYANKR